MGNLNRKRTQLLFNAVDTSSLTYDSAATPDTLMIKNYNIFGQTGTTLRKFKKTTTNAGIKQAAVFTPDFAYPTDNSHFDFELSIKGKTDLRQGRSDRLFLNWKTYQGSTGALAAAVSGKVANADEKNILDSVAASINADKWSPVTATVFGDDTDGYALYLVAKSASVKFDLGVSQSYGAITANGGLSASGADGAVAVATAVLTSAGGAFTVDGLIGHKLFIIDSASTLGGVAYAITDNDATTITKSGNFGVLETALEFVVIGGQAKYPVLTLEDVQKVFPIKAHNAGMSADLFPSPAYTVWAKYYFKIERSGVQGAYALDGANHMDSYIEEVEIYVPESVAEASSGANFEDKIYDWLTGISYVDPNGDTSPWDLAHN